MNRGSFRKHLVAEIATEISRLTRYYDRVVQCLPLPQEDGGLLEAIDCPEKRLISEVSEIPDFRSERERRSVVLMNGVLNENLDIEGLLRSIREKLSRTSRVIVVAYNSYLRWPYAVANSLGLRRGALPEVFLTRADLENIAELADFEIVRMRPVTYVPARILGVGTFLNFIAPIFPVLRWTSLATVLVLRPKISETALPSVSVIIPARNEAGNIRGALERLPDFHGATTELIFVEGHSQDETWTEIEKAVARGRPGMKIHAFRQTGHGKNDAVQLGVKKASHELTVILDADLTMPPELLTRYYDAYRAGKADFVNGSRLVYPIEGQEMKFLNLLGNVFFSKALSAVLETRLSDTLCGTKLLARHDWNRVWAWNEDFGDFDPFGDFELLFAASTLGLGIINLPVRYRARTYGSTNILRFRHGWILLKMAVIGLFRIRAGQGIRSR